MKSYSRIKGEPIIIPFEKLTEALHLMWRDEIEPEEIDFYVMGNWN